MTKNSKEELSPGIYILASPLAGNNRIGHMEYRIIYLEPGHDLHYSDLKDMSYPNMEKLKNFENLPFTLDYDRALGNARKISKTTEYKSIERLKFNRSFCAMRRRPDPIPRTSSDSNLFTTGNLSFNRYDSDTSSDDVYDENDAIDDEDDDEC